jgi:hypothetical protein
MNRPLRLGRAEALDTAIELAKRLDEAAGVALVGIESTAEATSVQLSIAVNAEPGIRRLRRRLWSSFVSRNVAGRRALLLRTAAASARRRTSIAASAARTERAGEILAERGRGTV